MSESEQIHKKLDSFFQLTQWSQEHEGGEANEEWDRGFQAAMALVKSYATDSTDSTLPKIQEPNGTLVMTTCKCRENTTNLVMTRAWFEEQLENKIAQGNRLATNHAIERIKAQICFDALADSDGRCANHSGKCYELGLLVKELAND
jgi:hypothetical protein